MVETLEHSSEIPRRYHVGAIACLLVGLIAPPVTYFLAFAQRSWEYGCFGDLLTFGMPIGITVGIGIYSYSRISSSRAFVGKGLVTIGIVSSVVWEVVLFCYSAVLIMGGAG